MGLEERVYSMLVISGGDKFKRAMEGFMPGSLLSHTQFAGSISEGRRALNERAFDFVLVNSPLPDGAGVGFAIDVSEASERVVVLMVKAELHGGVYQMAASHGVFTLQKPLSGSGMDQALRWMVSAREKLRGVERKSLSLEEKMAEIRLVNRAKWLLIESCGMDEPQAHRYIEKLAMDRGVAKGQAAQRVLDGEFM